MEDASEATLAPVYTIDLSLQPEDRYKALAGLYKTQLRSLTGLFNSLLSDLGLPHSYHGPINLLARVLLRGVHSSVETAELQGIAEVTEIPLYLLVGFNTILDCLMGCTSGAVKSLEKGQSRSQTRMLHFRTLDWSMDPLRNIIVQLEFVRTRSANPQQVLARSITYVGFVGVLTGVRKDLSISLNFRAVHNATSRRDNRRFYFHHLMVLLGRRQSISSLLRGYLIFEDRKNEYAPPLEDIAKEVVPHPTTAAYLIFCDGISTMVMEKDYDTAIMRSSDTFIVVTNHDEDDEHPNLTKEATPLEQIATNDCRVRVGMEALVEDSRDRLDAITSRWQGLLRKTKRQAKKDGKDPSLVECDLTVTRHEVVNWVSAYPTTNEETHFATVMDPKSGKVLWTRVYPYLGV